MNLNDLRWIVPTPPQQPIQEILQAHQVTREFYREVRYREDFDRYCDWYYQTAAANRRDLAKMRGDINIFGWFLRPK